MSDYECDKPQNTMTGEADWSHLFRPDYKYNKKDGVFSLGLTLIGGAQDSVLAIIREAAGLMSQAERCTDFAPPPFIKDEETGIYTFKFKQNAVIYPKGEDPIEMKVDVYDAKRNPWPQDVEIGKGSMVKVRYKANAWNSTEQGGIGVTLRLYAVQVINHVPYVPSHGFDEEEGVDMSGVASQAQEASGSENTPAEKPYGQHTGGPVVADIPF